MRCARVFLLLGLAGGLTSCRRPIEVAPTVEIPPPTLPPISTWPNTLAAANRAALEGRFREADSLLAKHALDHAGTAEGLEADYWRALLRLDPFNKEASSRDALSSLDSYLNAGPSAARYHEARILRRLIESLDSSRAALETVRSEADKNEKDRNEAYRKLGDELEKTMAELDRIRRRLAQKP